MYASYRLYEGIIIGVTGNAIQAEVDLYLASGADKVMIKPLDMTDLKNFLAGLLELWTPNRREKMKTQTPIK